IRARRIYYLGLPQPGGRLPEIRRWPDSEQDRPSPVRFRVPPRVDRGFQMIAKMITKRLLVSLVILFVVSLLVFVATLLLPGDPAQAILGQQATPERLEALREQMNLNDPVWVRYFTWIGGLFTGNLGYSAASGGPV